MIFLDLRHLACFFWRRMCVWVELGSKHLEKACGEDDLCVNVILDKLNVQKDF